MIGSRVVESYVGSGTEVVYTHFNNPVEIKGARKAAVDAADYSAISRLVEAEKPEIVIDTIAHPSVDFCDKDRLAAYRINAASCEAAAVASRKVGARLAFISTAFVFGMRDSILTEADTPDPICTYGWLKLLGEEAAKIAPEHLILRTDQVYGWGRPGQKKSFVQNAIEKMEKGEKVEVCEDWFNNPTYAANIVDAAVKLLGKKKTGIYHATGSSFLNRVDWAKMIARKTGLDESLVVAINSSKLNLPAKRSKCHLSNQKIALDSGVKMLGVEDGLAAVLRDRKAMGNG